MIVSIQRKQTSLARSTRALLAATAFVGSALYGASLAHALGDAATIRGAMWLIASAGLSWCVFGPLLLIVTGRSLRECVDACLVTMACGIAVLTAGAFVNFTGIPVPPIPFNWTVVGLSNVVMAAVLVRRMRSIGVAPFRPLAVWIVGLDAVGALLFWLFRGLIQGGR